MKCFYHSADLDGHCSGAIVKARFPECEMIGINYGERFPLEAVEPHEHVIMVDFSLDPEEMYNLGLHGPFTWIDHHKTALEAVEKSGYAFPGKSEIGKAGCELAWEYLFHGREIPLAVHFLGRYDVWDHSDPRVLPFQYRMRMEDLRPINDEAMKKWLLLFGDEWDFQGESSGMGDIGMLVDEGRLLLRYEEEQNAKFCRAYAFETTLDPLRYDRSGQTCRLFRGICINRGFTNSQIFNSVYDPVRHDLMITFCRLKPPAHKWTVSLYSTKKEVDCGEIAKIFGGGGHKGAAGFQCEELPFVY